MPVTTSTPTTTTTSTSRRSSSRGRVTDSLIARHGATKIALPSATVRWTSAADGDLGVTAADGGVDRRRQAVAAGAWSWCHQVHGSTVHVVRAPGQVQGDDGDALVSARDDVVLAVFTADCAPVAFGSDNGVVGVAHAGWRGLCDGVLEATVAAMREEGAVNVVAALGPCIRPGCYEFGSADLDAAAEILGPTVRATTAGGRPALDVAAGVAAALAGVGVALVHDQGSCTACDPGYFSHRARRDVGRQATVVVPR